MALANVRPVGDIDAAVGAVFGMHAAEPRVLREAKIGAVMGDVAAAVRLQDVTVQALTMDVEHEGIAAILGGPVVAQVDHAADVGMSAAVIVMRRPAASGRP